MQRRHFLFLASLLPPALLAPLLLRAGARQSPPTRNLADEANQIDELASNIHILPDARRLIDYIAEIFADELPPAWATECLRSRLAEGEYLSVTNLRISDCRRKVYWHKSLPIPQMGAPHLESGYPAEMNLLHRCVGPSMDLSQSSCSDAMVSASTKPEI